MLLYKAFRISGVSPWVKINCHTHATPVYMNNGGSEHVKYYRMLIFLILLPELTLDRLSNNIHNFKCIGMKSNYDEIKYYTVKHH